MFVVMMIITMNVDIVIITITTFSSYCCLLLLLSSYIIMIILSIKLIRLQMSAVQATLAPIDKDLLDWLFRSSADSATTRPRYVSDTPGPGLSIFGWQVKKTRVQSCMLLLEAL